MYMFYISMYEIEHSASSEKKEGMGWNGKGFFFAFG